MSCSLPVDTQILAGFQIKKTLITKQEIKWRIVYNSSYRTFSCRTLRRFLYCTRTLDRNAIKPGIEPLYQSLNQLINLNVHDEHAVDKCGIV